jgi:hypothetical protein
VLVHLVEQLAVAMAVVVDMPLVFNLARAEVALVDILEVVVLALQIPKLLGEAVQAVLVVVVAVLLTRQAVGAAQLDCMAKEPVAKAVEAQAVMVDLDLAATIFTMEMVVLVAAMAVQVAHVYYGEPDEHFLVLM